MIPVSFTTSLAISKAFLVFDEILNDSIRFIKFETFNLIPELIFTSDLSSSLHKLYKDILRVFA